MERWLPDLRLYELITNEIREFVPPEECLKIEFSRYLSHPAIILRFIPESAFEQGPRSLPWQLQFPSNQMPALDDGSSQLSILAYMRNTIRNFLLHQHLCLKYLTCERPAK